MTTIKNAKSTKNNTTATTVVEQYISLVTTISAKMRSENDTLTSARDAVTSARAEVKATLESLRLERAKFIKVYNALPITRQIEIRAEIVRIVAHAYDATTSVAKQGVNAGQLIIAKEFSAARKALERFFLDEKAPTTSAQADRAQSQFDKIKKLGLTPSEVKSLVELLSSKLAS